jgi:hypothetical protein
VSIAANILLLVPIVTITMNFLMTMRGHYHMVYHSPTMRFTFFGAIAFVVASVVGLVSSLRSADRLLHFTQFQVAQQHLLLYAFFSMIMFGAIYYITPRLVGCEWLSASLIKVHFWGSAYGGGMMIVLLAFAGPRRRFGLCRSRGDLATGGADQPGLPSRPHRRLCPDVDCASRVRPSLRPNAPADRATCGTTDPLRSNWGGETLMSRSSYLFGGIFGSFALSCFALVMVPQGQIGRLAPHADEEAGTVYPLNNARQGREVYAAQGCFYCHYPADP